MLTEYDADNNDGTLHDTSVVVECSRYNIRWCGDGLVSNGEACDPADASRAGWGAGGCSALCQPVTVITPPTPSNFDLRIKKYAKSEDIFAQIESTEDYNYNVVVQNVGPETTTGITTVVDILPSPIVLRATPTGNGWSCTGTA